MKTHPMSNDLFRIEKILKSFKVEFPWAEGIASKGNEARQAVFLAFKSFEKQHYFQMHKTEDGFRVSFPWAREIVVYDNDQLMAVLNAFRKLGKHSNKLLLQKPNSEFLDDLYDHREFVQRLLYEALKTASSMQGVFVAIKTVTKVMPTERYVLVGVSPKILALLCGLHRKRANPKKISRLIDGAIIWQLIESEEQIDRMFCPGNSSSMIKKMKERA